MFVLDQISNSMVQEMGRLKEGLFLLRTVVHALI